jgi:hypothetical protein
MTEREAMSDSGRLLTEEEMDCKYRIKVEAEFTWHYCSRHNLVVGENKPILVIGCTHPENCDYLLTCSQTLKEVGEWLGTYTVIIDGFARVQLLPEWIEALKQGKSPLGDKMPE